MGLTLRVPAIAMIALSLLLPASMTARASETFADTAHALLTAVYRADGPGAAVIVSTDGTVLYHDAVGMADLELAVPLDADHVFRLGSITKQFTAAGILALADDGQLSLDDPITRFVPAFPSNGITIHHLLNHTSGIPSYTSLHGYLHDGRMRNDLDTSALLNVFADEPRDFAPGADWGYSNSGYALLGAAIESITGLPWHEFLSRRFFDPLELTSIGAFRHETIVRGRARGYHGRHDALINAPWISMSQAHAASALYGTVADVDRWQRALHGGRVISDDMLARMLTTDPRARGVRGGIDYGYGAMIDTVRGRPAVSHSGGIHGFASYALWIVDARLSIVVLSNHSSAEVTPATVARRLAAWALGDPYPVDAPPVPVPASVLASLSGVYEADDGDVIELSVRDGALMATRAGRSTVVRAVRPDRFVYPLWLTYVDVIHDSRGPDALLVYRRGEGEPQRFRRAVRARP
jgi:D-alanyl-D-alanine carboxypeptidase